MSAAAPVRIVPFQPPMLPQLADLWVEAWAHTIPAIDFAARRAWFEARLTGFHEQGIGIAVAQNSLSGELAGLLTLDHSTGEIDQIAVARPHWGKHTASALMTFAKLARPGGLWLTVNQENLRAVAFYERQGFKRGAAGLSVLSGQPTWVYRWDSQALSNA